MLSKRRTQGEQSRAEGDAFFLKGKLSDALRCYTRAIGLNPHDHESLSKRAAVYIRLKDVDSAKKDFQTVSEIEMSEPRGYYNKATSLLALHQYEDAMAVFEKGLRRYPSDSALLLGWADAKEAKTVDVRKRLSQTLSDDGVSPTDKGTTSKKLG